jgi:DNA-binding PadR family transcriptional regulator
MAAKKEEQHTFDVALAVQVGVEKALLLGGFNFWITENEKRKSELHFRQGEYWTYDTAKQLAAKYPYLKEKSIYRWLDELEQGDWIKKRQFAVKGNLDTRNWFGRGKRLLEWLGAPVSQNENSVSHFEKWDSQNEKPVSQNETANSQNEKPLYNKETVTNPLQTAVINNQQQLADASAAGGDDLETDSVGDQKKGRGPTPNPLPTAEEVRQALLTSAPHQRYVLERLKLTDSEEGYIELVDTYLVQQQAKADDPDYPCDSISHARKHFMNWLGRRTEIQNTQKQTQTHGTQTTRTARSLRPTSLGQPDYRGTGSHCDVDL